MFRPSASVAVIFFFGRIHMISGECPKYEALLHNFKPMYYIDHRETIQMWAKVIPERWQDNRLINAVIRLKNKLPGNINRLSESPVKVSFAIKTFSEDSACNTLKAVSFEFILFNNVLFLPASCPADCDHE
ncbi:hypothetical protein P5673_016754 [Acropora cervicornis]|uniref:Uncharacterized protein n=1 Tax=Acropora cervicornis TaxID=6130 RepID=A0AAD9QFJ8_ACRCE|nr:hypothetical protein P5673_016754 [Acropora cervicornis]